MIFSTLKKEQAGIPPAFINDQENEGERFLWIAYQIRKRWWAFSRTPRKMSAHRSLTYPGEWRRDRGGGGSVVRTKRDLSMTGGGIFSVIGREGSSEGSESGEAGN